jgi:hypothetical protein
MTLRLSWLTLPTDYTIVFIPGRKTQHKKSGLALVLTRFIIYNNFRLLKTIDFQKPKIGRGEKI